MSNKICTVTTLKDSLENTMNFVNYHLNLGIDHMYIIFDNPKDKAIKKLKNNSRVTAIKGDLKYWKNVKNKFSHILDELLNFGYSAGTKSKYLGKVKKGPKIPHITKQELNALNVLDLARDANYDWICHLDGDELIYSKTDIKKILKKVSNEIDVIRLISLEAVPEKMHYKNLFREVTLFKDIRLLAKFYYPNKFKLQKIFPVLKRKAGNLSGNYFNSHLAGKSILKVFSDIKRVGIHEPVPKDGTKFNEKYFLKLGLLHFDCSGFKEWKHKWSQRFNGGVSQSGMKAVGVKRFEEFVEVYNKNNEKQLVKLYKKQNFIGALKRELFLFLGLLKRIKIKENMFLTSKKI